MKRIILTGAPGAGKTVLIRELERLGHAVVEEAATDVIALEQARGTLRPHEHPQFIETIMQLQLMRMKTASGALQLVPPPPSEPPAPLVPALTATERCELLTQFPSEPRAASAASRPIL